jgi:O-antigen/teichoic acid export membrane protein
MTGASAVERAYAGVLPARSALASIVLWLFVSNVFYSACQWGTVVVLAKLGAPNALGHFGLATAVVGPVVILTSMAMRSYLATDVHRRYGFAEYLNLRLAAHVAAATIILLVAAAGVVPASAAAIVLPLGLAKLAEATSETCYGVAQRNDRMRFVALSQAARAGLGLGALVAVVALGGTLAEATWALAAVWAAALLAVDLPAAHALEPALARPNVGRLWALARECAPLGMLFGVSAIKESLPRYLLQASHGAAAVGYFTALQAVGPLLGQLASAVGHGAAPRLGWNASRDPRRYRALVTRLLAGAVLLTVVVTAGAVVGGRLVLTVAYAADYAAYTTPFALLVLAGGLSLVNAVAYFALLAIRRRALLVGLQTVALAVTAASGLWLVPRMGVVGAAAAAALGTAVLAALSAGILLRPGART